MMRIRAHLLMSLAVLLAPMVSAHDGQQHESLGAGPDTQVWTGPAWTPEGRLYVPKSLQRLLGIRTELADASVTRLRLPATVSLPPDSAGLVNATEAGRIEPAGTWPLPGQQLRQGEVLARLYPALSEREKARRRVELAQIEQRRVIAKVNVDRLRVQVAGADGKIAPGNIYYEQAESELRGLEEAYRARLEGLESWRELRAPLAGRLVAVDAFPGQLVHAGAPLFTVAGAGTRRLEVMHNHAGLGDRTIQGSLLNPAAQTLRVRGEVAMTDRPGWRLLLETEAADELIPGQVVEVELRLRDEDAPHCKAGDEAEIWLHVAPELFESHPACGFVPERHAESERRVTQGAALLSRYHDLVVAP